MVNKSTNYDYVLRDNAPKRIDQFAYCLRFIIRFSRVYYIGLTLREVGNLTYKRIRLLFSDRFTTERINFLYDTTKKIKKNNILEIRFIHLFASVPSILFLRV